MIASHHYNLAREHGVWSLWRRDDNMGVIVHIDRSAGQVWWPSGEKPAGRWVAPITDFGIEYVVGKILSWRGARRWWALMLADELEDLSVAAADAAIAGAEDAEVPARKASPEEVAT